MARKNTGITKKIENLKKDMIGEVFSPIELDNIMGEIEFYLVEVEDDKKKEKEETDIIKYTNYKTEIWIDGTFDEENNMLVSDVKRINNINNTESTRVLPFKTFDDVNAVLVCFKTHEQYHHWLCGWLCLSLGRRIGDILALKWSDLYMPNGNYRERLTTLREEKTGKIVGVRLNVLAKMHIDEYCEIMQIKPMEVYREKIFSIGSPAFRKALKNAVSEVGLMYPISTHSFRKFYANTIYKLHPRDSDNLSIVQFMLGQSDPSITRIYINEIDNKIDKYNDDYVEHIVNNINGNRTDISNSPVVSFKSEDFREILSQCWEMARNEEDKFEGLSKMISVAESKMV